MSSPECARKHHLNIYHSKNESDKELLRAWNKIYDKLEQLSHKMSANYLIDLIPVKNDKDILVIVTGRDLFLGLFDERTEQLTNKATLDEILITRGGKVHDLCKDIKQKYKIPYRAIAQDIEHAAGEYIPKVRAEESLISRLPHGLSVTHTDTPFVIDVRKDPQFKDHDYVYRIDQNTTKEKGNMKE